MIRPQINKTLQRKRNFTDAMREFFHREPGGLPELFIDPRKQMTRSTVVDKLRGDFLIGTSQATRDGTVVCPQQAGG